MVGIWWCAKWFFYIVRSKLVLMQTNFLLCKLAHHKLGKHQISKRDALGKEENQHGQGTKTVRSQTPTLPWTLQMLQILLGCLGNEWGNLLKVSSHSSLFILDPWCFLPLVAAPVFPIKVCSMVFSSALGSTPEKKGVSQKKCKTAGKRKKKKKEEIQPRN